MIIEIHQLVRSRLPKAWWQWTLDKAARHLKVSKEQSVSVVVVDEPRMRQLNKQYGGVDHVTDVLSFAERDSQRSSQWVEGYLGEIVICYPQAVRQARQYGHRVADELQLLVIHGLLHLLGYDHQSPRQAERMRKLEDAVIGRSISRTLGCGDE